MSLVSRKTDHHYITAVLAGTRYTISILEAASILHLSNEATAKLLARLAAKGWLMRIKRGLYVPATEFFSNDLPLEKQWLIAQALYRPCYIGGMVAAHYWGLTVKIARQVLMRLNSAFAAR